MERYIRSLTTLICGISGFLWGKPDGLILSLIAFMIMDYVTGLAAAWLKRELSSQTGFTGIAKKVYILVLVAVGHILDTYILGGGAVCRSAVTGFYIANEGISIAENAGAIGLPLPKSLVRVLKQLKEKEEK